MFLKSNIFTRTYRKLRSGNGVQGVILGSFKRPRRTVEPEVVRIPNRYQMVNYRKETPICEECGFNKATCTHHIVSFSDDGVDIPENYMSLCSECHNKKHPEITDNPCFWKNEYNQCIARHGNLTVGF